MKERNKDNNTRKLTTGAAMAALATALIVLTNFVPLKFSLLMVAALCFYVAFIRCGLMFGLLTIGASVLLAFFVQPFSSAFFLTVLVFAPYSILAYFCKDLHYTDTKKAVLRVGLVVAFAALSFVGVYLLAKFIEIDILAIIQRVGYFVVIVGFLISAAVFDFLFNQMSIRILRVIK